MPRSTAVVKTIAVTVTTGNQNLIYRELLQMGKHKLEILIDSDSYKFQSVAKISILQKGDGAIKWERLDYIPYNAMNTKEGLCYQPDVHAGDRTYGGNLPVAKFQHYFMADRTTLLANARQLLVA